MMAEIGTGEEGTGLEKSHFQAGEECTFRGVKPMIDPGREMRRLAIPDFQN